MWEKHDKGAVSHLAISTLHAYYQQQYEVPWDGVVLREHLSNLFARKADIHVSANRPTDVLDLRVYTEIKNAELTATSKTTLKNLKDRGINWLEVARTGAGGYHPYPIKSLINWVRDEKVLQRSTDRLWRYPWWQESGLPNTLEMLKAYKEKSIHNGNRCLSDPELLVGGKDPETGTGWGGKLSTRGDAAKYFDQYGNQVIDVVTQYYDDMLDAVAVWPEHDSLIHVGQGWAAKWAGIRGGVRSDADVLTWPELGTQTIESNTRRVANDPSSILHNPTLDERPWRIDLWNRFQSEYHLSPYKHESELEALMHPPVSADFFDPESDEIFVLSVDAGYQIPSSKITNGRFIQGDAVSKFGADQIALHGIVLKSSERGGFYFPHLNSGSPFTMAIYLTLFGEAIAAYLRRKQLNSIKIYQVGDDIHMVGPARQLALVMNSELAPWLRTKGMMRNTNFVTGRYVHWKDKDNAAWWVMPRVIKTATSPKAAKKGEKSTQTPFDDQLIAEDEDTIQAEEFSRLYPDYLYFAGDPNEWRAIMDSISLDAKIRLARQGFSEWASLFVGEDSDVWL